MSIIEYVKFSEVDPSGFLPLLNSQKTREHLIEHEKFDEQSVELWMESKIKVDSTCGCKVRAVLINKKLAGWCGIQLEDEKYEVAMVIDEKYRGIGKQVFFDIMRWAKDLAHDEVFVHFLHTRPEYKFLRKMAQNVYESEIFGDKFTTYQLAVK